MLARVKQPQHVAVAGDNTIQDGDARHMAPRSGAAGRAEGWMTNGQGSALEPTLTLRPEGPPAFSERLLAAVAHLLLLLSLPGLLAATAICFIYRRRSSFVSHQARQAVLWQVLSNIVLFLLLGLLFFIT